MNSASDLPLRPQLILLAVVLAAVLVATTAFDAHVPFLALVGPPLVVLLVASLVARRSARS